MKISILGAGALGTQIAMLRGITSDDEMVLFGRNLVRMIGEAMDINQACSVAKTESICSASVSPLSIEHSDICIITAGERRKPGMIRADLFHVNAPIVRKMAQHIMNHSPNSLVIVVSNPLDAMTHTVNSVLRNPKKVIGMGNELDTARYREVIREKTGRRRDDVFCVVSGGRDTDTQSHLPSDNLELVEKSRKLAINTISKKGSTIFAPALATVKLIETIERGGYSYVSCLDESSGSYYGRLVGLGRFGICT
jgi:malate dehydrogenase